MGIIQNYLRKNFGTPLANSIGLVARNFGDGSKFNPQRQLQGITYKAIDKIGLSLSVYEAQVNKPNGDVYANHPLYNLFNNPNPRQSPSDFTHLYGMLYEIYGETFWYLARGENTNRIKEIYLLPPDRMELVLSEGELVGYVLHKSNGTQVPFELDEIVHDKRPNPFNEWRGLSVLEKASAYVDTEISTTHFTLNYINNAAAPSGIVTLPSMAPDAFQAFVNEWRENYEGPKNAGKTGFIRKVDKDSAVDFKQIGSTLKDIDAKVIRDMSKEDVLLMLDMPKELLGWTNENGFGRNTFEAAYYVFATSKLEPMMRRLDRIWETIGLQLMGGQTLDVSHESPVPEDKEYMLAVAEKGVNKWLTVNEIREQSGLPPLPGYDEIKEFTPPQVANQPPQKSLKIVKAEKPSAVENLQKISADQEEFRSKLVDTNEIYLRRYQSTLSSFAAAQEDRVIANINASSKAYEEWTFSIKEESEKLAKELQPVVIALIEAQSEGVANFITGELLTISPELRKTVEQNILAISGLYNQETLQALEATLSQGQTAGESLVKLKKRVEAVYNDAKGYRAERIARTETLKASNLTAEEVYKQNGYSAVEWFTNPGACEFCRSFSGRRKTIGGEFTKVGDVITGTEGNQLRIEYSDIATPPLHPNCTCSLIPVEA